MQFFEGKSKVGKCPICGKNVPKRTTRAKDNYCSRVCASQKRYAQRYQGSGSGPADRPKMMDKTKLNNF